MNRLAFVGVLQRGESVTRQSGEPLPEGLLYLLTTPMGKVDLVEQDEHHITVKNAGPGVASYMIFVVDQVGMTRLSALRQLADTFSKPKPKTTPRTP